MSQTPSTATPRHPSALGELAPVPLQPHLPVASRAVTLARFYGVQIMAAIFPSMAGLILYGWRALATMLVVATAAGLSAVAWRRIGIRGRSIRISRTIWLATLLSLMLPPHLLTDEPADVLPWLLLPAAGLLLVIMLWLIGNLRIRLHPAVVTYLLLALCFGRLLTPHLSLQRQRVLGGDVLNAHGPSVKVPPGVGWISRSLIPGHDATQSSPASDALIAFTRDRQAPPRGWLSMQAVLRDRMPPLEDLVIGGHPGPIGASSAIAIIIGGLFLLYRGIADFRIPLLVCLTAYAAMRLAPVPVVVSDAGAQWHWIFLDGGRLDWTIAVTFANYELMAGPLLLVAFFIATDPEIRPLTGRGRVFFAMIVGLLAAAAQLYVSVAIGAYLAVLLAGMLTPMLDRRLLRRPLL